MRDQPEEGFVTKTNMERITNGIFAFTMTLLARNIVLPVETTIPESEFLLFLLTKILPQILNFIVAFLVLAMLWFFIYQIYRNITAVDRPFAYLMMLFLMFLVFTPFASEVSQMYANATASTIFETTLLLLGIISVLLWVYAVRSPQIINPNISGRRSLFQGLKYCIIPLVSMIALAFSFSGDPTGENVYLIAPVIFFAVFQERFWNL